MSSTEVPAEPAPAAAPARSRLSRVLHSTALWGGVWGLALFLVVLGNLPWLAHVLRGVAPRPNAGELTDVLDAIYTTRRAARAGERTLLIAGSSVSMHLDPSDWLPETHGANASLLGTGVFLRTVHARYLIDYAPADILIVPVVWNGFPDVRTERPLLDPRTRDWIPNPEDQWIRQGFGFAYLDGLPLQFVRLFEEKLTALRHPQITLLRTDLSPTPYYYQRIRELPERVPRPSPRSVQRMETLRAYGAARGVAVLYYLSPHNPTYFERGLLRPGDFERFRVALRPHLFVDLGDRVPAEDFGRDLVHMNWSGLDVTGAALAEALRTRPIPDPPGTLHVPGPLERLRLGVRWLVDAHEAGFYRWMRPVHRGRFVDLDAVPSAPQ